MARPALARGNPRGDGDARRHLTRAGGAAGRCGAHRVDGAGRAGGRLPGVHRHPHARARPSGDRLRGGADTARADRRRRRRARREPERRVGRVAAGWHAHRPGDCDLPRLVPVPAARVARGAQLLLLQLACARLRGDWPPHRALRRTPGRGAHRIRRLAGRGLVTLRPRLSGRPRRAGAGGGRDLRRPAPARPIGVCGRIFRRCSYCGRRSPRWPWHW